MCLGEAPLSRVWCLCNCICVVSACVGAGGAKPVCVNACAASVVSPLQVTRIETPMGD